MKQYFLHEKLLRYEGAGSPPPPPTQKQCSQQRRLGQKFVSSNWLICCTCKQESHLATVCTIGALVSGTIETLVPLLPLVPLVDLVPVVPLGPLAPFVPLACLAPAVSLQPWCQTTDTPLRRKSVCFMHRFGEKVLVPMVSLSQ